MHVQPKRHVPQVTCPSAHFVHLHVHLVPPANRFQKYSSPFPDDNIVFFSCAHSRGFVIVSEGVDILNYFTAYKNPHSALRKNRLLLCNT